MIFTGLVSISFGKLSTDEIIELTLKAGLQGIEWGGRMHVPHGDVQTAQKVRKATIEAGLKIASYGSFYRVGTNANGDITFKEILETASALEAPTIRVWAGNLSSASADEEARKKVVEESRYIADLAQEQGISVAYEYHDNTLTDSTDSALKLLREVDHPNIFTYWQLPLNLGFEDRLNSLKMIKPWLRNIHVFYWDNYNRLELSEGENEWYSYINEICDVPGDRYVMLEFVKDDLPVQLFEDAKTLKRIIIGSGGNEYTCFLERQSERY